MTSNPYDIVMLPAPELAQEAIAFSEQLERYGTLFTLKDGAYFPHASLYMTQLRDADIDSVNARLSSIAAATPPPQLTAARYHQAEGYIDVDYERTQVLDRLQMAVVEAINPLRDGMREKDKARLATASGKVRENLEVYGYRGVGELFRPHLTVTRFANGQVIDASKLPAPNKFSGTAVALGLFAMGDNGTCVRQVAVFPFSVSGTTIKVNN